MVSRIRSYLFCVIVGLLGQFRTLYVFGTPVGITTLNAVHGGESGKLVGSFRETETVRGVEPGLHSDDDIQKFEGESYKEWEQPCVRTGVLSSGYIRSGRYALTEGGHVIDDAFRADVEKRGINIRRELFRIKPRLRLREYNTVCLLGGRWSGSHFHWLMDVIPRIGILERLDLRDSIEHYAMPEGVIDQHVESLSWLGVSKDQMLLIDPDEMIRARNLYVTTAPRGEFSRWACGYVRRSFLSKVRSEERRSRRIYVSRTGTRSVVNEAEVLRVVEKRGFERVQLENYTFDQQVSMFRNAEAVIGPHGAGITNIVFCRPQTIVGEIFDPRYINVCNARISSILDLDYHCIRGILHESKNIKDRKKDIFVDAKKLDEWIRYVLGM